MKALCKEHEQRLHKKQVIISNLEAKNRMLEHKFRMFSSQSCISALDAPTPRDNKTTTPREKEVLELDFTPSNAR
jgi:hypothetical protein